MLLPRSNERGLVTPNVIVLMGVSGCGKSTIGRRLGRVLGWTFRDADTFHPEANIAKMSRGEPLDDIDRGPWLQAIADWVDGHRRAGSNGVVSCSALKRRYREVIVGNRSDVGLVYLKGNFDLINDRISRRRGHFMPPALLRSQFQALEEPDGGEAPLIVPVRMPPKRVVDRIVEAYGLTPERRVLG